MFLFILTLIVAQRADFEIEVKSAKDKPSSLIERTDDQNGSFVESTKHKNRLVVESIKNQIGSKEEIVFSCRNRCGRLLNLPCSCDVICQVYHNCCEDFFKECELFILKVDSRYKYHNNLPIECSSDNVLLISSCNEISDKKKTTFNAQIQNKDPGDLTNAGSRKWTLKKIFQNTPVTESASRLAFKNRSIFNCNSYFRSNPLIWNALFDHLETTESEQNYFISLNEQYKPMFAPSRDKNEFLQPHQCISYSIGNCSISKYKDLCSSFTSYVRAENMLVYDNVYCAQCAGLNDTRLLMPVTSVGSESRPKISMSSTFNYDKVTFQTEDISSSQSWHILECVLDQKSQNHLKCRITACNSVYYKFYAGQCLQLSVLSVAFFNVAKQPSSLQVQKMSAYIMCLLKYYANHFLVGEWRPARMLYYEHSFLLGHYLVFPTNYSRDIFDFYEKQISLYRLILISELLKFKLGMKKVTSQTNKSLEDIVEIPLDAPLEVFLGAGNLNNVSTNLVSGEGNATTVCACVVPVDKAEMMSLNETSVCNYTCYKSSLNETFFYYESMCPLFEDQNVNSGNRCDLTIFTSIMLPLIWLM
ncbi:hypothetical protein BgiBS90_012255 [Biomphalaria glabrata]|nr:hypothetical protein BgiBS90_012255 [Biomphalaria glabrata]